MNKEHGLRLISCIKSSRIGQSTATRHIQYIKYVCVGNTYYHMNDIRQGLARTTYLYGVYTENLAGKSPNIWS
jgi:hypothetical protein